jgi:spermidine synthase
MNWDVDVSEEAGVRYLHFGSEWVQGAMRIRKPDALELEYTREMMLGFVLRESPWPRSATLIGLGAGSIAKFVRRQAPECRTTVVEIAPQVVACARLFFKLPEEDAHFRIVIDDGAEYVSERTRRVDLIVVDGFDPEAKAGPLDTDPFYAACRARLTRNGVCAINLFGGQRTRYARSMDRIERAFDGRVIALPPCASGNVIAFGFGDDGLDVTMDALRERALALKAASGLDLRPTLQRLQYAQAMPGGRLTIA